MFVSEYQLQLERCLCHLASFTSNMNDDSTSLLEFLADCHFPQTIRVEEGFDSPVSEEASLSQGEILYLHHLQDQHKAIARGAGQDHFCIPLNYPGNIFESISNRCREEYDTVGQLLVPFPKYVRPMRNIPQFDITGGSKLQLLEVMTDAGGNSVLRCHILGTNRSVTLGREVVGPFETFENVKSKSIREIIDDNLLPTRVRVCGPRTTARCGANKHIEFRGLFTIDMVVQEKVLVASTIAGTILRVMKLPINLQVMIAVADEPADKALFARICKLVDTEVNIDAVITTGKYGEASWMFDTKEEIPNQTESISEPPKPPPKPKKPNKLVKPNSDRGPRYAPSPVKPKSPLPRVPSKPRNDKGTPPVPQKPANIHQGSGPSSPAIPERPHGSKEGNCPKQNQQNSISASAGAVSPVKKRDERVDTVKVPSNTENADEDDGLYEPIDEDDGLYEPIVDFKPTLNNQDAVARPVAPHHENESQPGEHLKNLSVSAVGEQLTKLGMSQYVDIFAKNMVDGDLMWDLRNDELMVSLGVENAFHRKKLKKFIIEGWSPKL